MRALAHWAGLVAAVAAAMSPRLTAGDEPLTLRIGTIAPEGSPYHDICLSGARAITRVTKGALRFKVFPAASMGDEAQIMASVQEGRLDGFAGSAVAAFDQVPELAAFDLPYLLAGSAEVDVAMQGSWQLLRKTMAARGYEGMAYTEIGFRHLGSKKPIATLEDLRRTRIRSMPAPAYMRFWKLAGVPAFGIGSPEVVPRLEQGELDGFDSAITMMFASSFHLYIKHLTLTQHTFQPGIALLGPSARKRIPAALLPRISESMEAEIRESVRRVREVEKALLASLPQVGITVVAAPPAVAAHLRTHAVTVRAEWRKTATPAGRKLLDTVEKLLAQGPG